MSFGNLGTTMTDRAFVSCFVLFAFAIVGIVIISLLEAHPLQDAASRAIERTFVRLLTGRMVP